jgi:hypothetical protein
VEIVIIHAKGVSGDNGAVIGLRRVSCRPIVSESNALGGEESARD